MLTDDFRRHQIEQIDAMLLETREAIERAMQVEEQLVAQRENVFDSSGTSSTECSGGI